MKRNHVSVNKLKDAVKRFHNVREIFSTHLVLVCLYPGHNWHVRTGKQEDKVLKWNRCTDLTKQLVCGQFTASGIVFLIRERFVEAVIDESSTDIWRVRKALLWIISHKHKTVSNDLY